MTNYYTENLAEFKFRELEILRDILTAWLSNGLPRGFSEINVRPAFNKNNGDVFLVNDDYHVALLNDSQLEVFYTLPDSGQEGFLSSLIDENCPDSLSDTDKEYLLNSAIAAEYNIEGVWLKYKHSCD